MKSYEIPTEQTTARTRSQRLLMGAVILTEIAALTLSAYALHNAVMNSPPSDTPYVGLDYEARQLHFAVQTSGITRKK